MFLYVFLLVVLLEAKAVTGQVTTTDPGRIAGEEIPNTFQEGVTVAPPTTTESMNYIDPREDPGSVKVIPTPQAQGRDYMQKRDKTTVCNMMRDLYEEAHSLVHQTLNIRDAHEVTMAFQIGHLIGLIRERYRRLMEMYREMRDKESDYFVKRKISSFWKKEEKGHKAKTEIWPPGMSHVRLQFYIQIYEFIREGQMEIEKLTEVLDNMKDELGLAYTQTMVVRVTKRKRTMPPTKRNKNGRRRQANRIKKVERYKSRVREQYILRKLGMNETLHTTAKRFILGWPVENTWDNLHY